MKKRRKGTPEFPAKIEAGLQPKIIDWFPCASIAAVTKGNGWRTKPPNSAESHSHFLCHGQN